MTILPSRHRRRAFLQAWDHFWFRETPPHLMAIFRIVFGVFLLFYFGLQIPHIALSYSREGLLMPLYVPDHTLTLIFTPPSPAVADFIFWTFLVSLFCFTIGFLTNGTGVIAVLLYAYYWILSLFQFGTSFDRFFLFTLLVLALSGCGETFSADARIRRGSWTAWQPIAILPQRLLALQITMTYLGVGWQKLYLPDWQSGLILAEGFMGRWATWPAYAILRMNIPLWYYDRLNWLIKSFEITIPFGLWSRRYRWWYFAAGAAFHIFIAIALAIWWFVAFIPAYILLFSPEEIFAFIGQHFPRLLGTKYSRCGS